MDERAGDVTHRDTALKYLATINRQVLAEDTPPDFSFRYVDIGAVDSTGGIAVPNEMTMFSSAPSRARRIASPGATVISTVRTYLRAIGRVPPSDEPLVFSTGFAVAEAKPGTESRYLSYACRSEPFVGEVVARSVGVSYPAINPAELASIKVPVSGMEEQRRIADFLDDQVARIDNIIAARKRQKDLASTADEGHMEVALWHEGDSLASLRRFQTSVTTGPFGTVFAANEYTSEGVPMINPTHIDDGRLFPDPSHSISRSAAARLSRHRLRSGDIVTGRKGDIGRSAVVQVEQDGWICGSDAIAIHCDHKLLSAAYLDLVLHQSRVRADLASKSPGATMPSLNEGMLLSIEIPALNLNEQHRRAAKAHLIRLAGRETEGALFQSIQLLAEVKRALITAAVSGEFDVSTSDGSRVPV